MTENPYQQSEKYLDIFFMTQMRKERNARQRTSTQDSGEAF